MRVEELYPDFNEVEAFHNRGPMVRDFGEVLVEVADRGYDGDSRYLLRSEGRFGILIFGWGSCSMCDAMAACESYEDLQELYDTLQSQILWFTYYHEVREWIASHDWEASFMRLDGSLEFKHQVSRWFDLH